MALLTLQPPPGYTAYGFTGTIPGPVISPAKASSLWSDFSKRCQRAGLCMIWRVECQKRGQLHWHAVISAPSLVPLTIRATGVRGGYRSFNVRPGAWLWETWGACIRALGPVTFEGIRASSRMGLPGAEEHAACVQSSDMDTARGSWLRYLQDHASKRKQEQSAEVPRHWGIVGRSRYKVRRPVKVAELTPKQYAFVRRAYERLATPRRLDEKAMFGVRLGNRCRRGRMGRAVCFVNTETITRLIEWARARVPC